MAQTSADTVEISKVGVTVYLIRVTDVEVAVIPFRVTRTIEVDVVVKTTGGYVVSELELDESLSVTMAVSKSLLSSEVEERLDVRRVVLSVITDKSELLALLLSELDVDSGSVDKGSIKDEESVALLGVSEVVKALTEETVEDPLALDSDVFDSLLESEFEFEFLFDEPDDEPGVDPV